MTHGKQATRAGQAKISKRLNGLGLKVILPLTNRRQDFDRR